MVLTGAGESVSSFSSSRILRFLISGSAVSSSPLPFHGVGLSCAEGCWHRRKVRCRYFSGPLLRESIYCRNSQCRGYIRYPKDRIPLSLEALPEPSAGSPNSNSSGNLSGIRNGMDLRTRFTSACANAGSRWLCFLLHGHTQCVLACSIMGLRRDTTMKRRACWRFFDQFRHPSQRWLHQWNISISFHGKKGAGPVHLDGEDKKVHVEALLPRTWISRRWKGLPAGRGL